MEASESLNALTGSRSTDISDFEVGILVTVVIRRHQAVALVAEKASCVHVRGRNS